MSNILFERPRGTSWEAKWTDKHSNLIQSSAAAGFETRVSLGPDPLRTLELNYAILLAGTKGLTRDQLMGFFNQRGGNFDSFLVNLGALTKNPADSSVSGQILNVDVNGYAPIHLTHYVSDQENWQPRNSSGHGEWRITMPSWILPNLNDTTPAARKGIGFFEELRGIQ